MMQIMLAALTLDAHGIYRILVDLNISRQCNRGQLKSVVDNWLERIRRFPRPGLQWLTGMLDEAVQQAGLGLDADLMLFRKALHLLEGVVTDIGAPFGAADHVLIREVLLQLAREWPQRWIKPFFSRSFGTRLSNADLLGTALAFTMTLAPRMWPLYK
jgi:predicted unusual protein kinase regulating ubiquinone biosynthesis (AarF/ABC1/UbiB family)